MNDTTTPQSSDPKLPMPGLPMPEFEDFYKAVHQRAPFPWQARLAQQVGETGKWPDEIGIPTGLGKTACLDIAIWWLASEAHLDPAERNAPTRIWWVVNRRLLVDAVSDHAQKLQHILRDPRERERAPVSAAGSIHIDKDPQERERTAGGSDALACVGARLRHLTAGRDGEPLDVIRMRGGVKLRRPPNPSQPAVIVSTIPMYGSRLLFRGYGSSLSMRPIDAALAGADSLVLVDEAHLAHHLRQLIPKLRDCLPESVARLPSQARAAPVIVSLTATGDETDNRFELDAKDKDNEIVQRRLDACKPTEIDAAAKGDTAKALHDAALRLLSKAPGPSSCVVFCNTPAVARKVHSLIEKSLKRPKFRQQLATPHMAPELLLVTGRVRQADADKLREKLMSPVTGAPADRADHPESEPRQRHLLVIATQTLEVGADLDFDYLATEQCGVRALAQRLGRLNRLGDNVRSRAIYVHRPAPKRKRSSGIYDGQQDGWPVYGTEPEELLKRLQKHTDLNLCPRRIRDLLGEPGEDLGRAPEILPALLWEWVKTTTPPHGEAPVEPYFSGIQGSEINLSVIWRVHVPETASAQRNDAPGEDAGDTEDAADDTTADATGGDDDSSRRQRLWPPVTRDEAVELPVYELRQAMDERGVSEVTRLITDEYRLETVPLRDLRPGDTVVLRTDEGMYDEFGWAPDTPEPDPPVSDLSIRRSGLPLDEETLVKRLLRGALDKDREMVEEVKAALRQLEQSPDDEEPDENIQLEGAQRLIKALRGLDAAAIGGFDPGEWTEFLDGLEPPTPVYPPDEVARLELLKPESVIRRDELDELRRDELDEFSQASGHVEKNLEAHGRAVGERAGKHAAALGLAGEIAHILTQAGKLHDIGKADRRFQRWLNPKFVPGAELLAKSDPADTPADTPRHTWESARRASGWPRGGRHEDLSCRLAAAWLAENGHSLETWEEDLLLHLVISHHGKGRPLVLPASDSPQPAVKWEFDDSHTVAVSADLSEVDWCQPGRFKRLNDRFGPWGLALLEAIVRQADHEMSASATDRYRQEVD